MDMADLGLPQVKLLTGNYDIIDSGCVVLQMGEYLDFQVADLKFRVEFIDEPVIEGATREGRISTGVVNPSSADAYYRIALYNQDMAFFSSSSNFLDVATLEGKSLKLKFSVQAINNRVGSSDKIFFYTWYLEKEASIQTANNVPQQ